MLDKFDEGVQVVTLVPRNAGGERAWEAGGSELGLAPLHHSVEISAPRRQLRRSLPLQSCRLGIRRPSAGGLHRRITEAVGAGQEQVRPKRSRTFPSTVSYRKCAVRPATSTRRAPKRPSTTRAEGIVSL